MALARQRHDWSRTSSLMALIANTQRDPRKHRAFRPGDFDPFAASGKAAPRVGVGVLKTVFIDKTMPKEVLEQ
ncbi:MAG: hypothetical protein D6727_10640 [Gammaproteobacteria bacterium]|nr:MAG: hypothetical protein D6727_10640 [Gammaproteobacteria bacterium]